MERPRINYNQLSRTCHSRYGRANSRALPRVVEISNISWSGRAIFQDPFLKKESNSLLALLTDEAYEAGLQRILRTVEAYEASGEPVEFRSELAFGMVSGRYIAER